MTGWAHAKSPGARVHSGLSVSRRVVRMAPSTSNQARCVLACALKDPRETLSQDQMEQYDSCVEFVSTFGLEESEAEKVVKESFGWAGRKYWRKQRINDPPELDQAQAAVSFLTETGGLSEAQVPLVMKKFPQVLGLPAQQMQYAVETLQKEWRIKGKALTGTIKNNPNLLGCYIDCYGDCTGDCERCWQRF